MGRLREWGRQRKAIAVGVVVLVALGAAVAVFSDPADNFASAPQLRHSAMVHDAGQASSAPGAAVVGSTSSALSAGSGSGGASADTAGAPAFTGPAPASSSPAPAGDNVVRRGSLDLEVRRGTFSDAFSRASEVATAHGGFPAGTTQSTHDDQLASGSLTLRVAGDRFDDAMRALKSIGRVKGEQRSGTEVGAQLVDLGARLASARVQEDALRALMGRANTVGETLQVQEQLGRVRQEIEQLTAEQQRLQDAVAMATIEVRLAEPGVATSRPDQRTGLARSFERAVDGAVAVVGGTIVVLGYLLPLLVLAALGWIAVRVGGARRRPAPSVTPG